MTTLTMKDEKRLEIIQRVFRGELTMAEAGLVLGVSERQCYRIKARVNQQGVKGVIHGNRGRLCKRKAKEKTVNRIVEFLQAEAALWIQLTATVSCCLGLATGNGTNVFSTAKTGTWWKQPIRHIETRLRRLPSVSK